ncbi:uncharacterized protein SPAPADRAFT_131868 [Spathaspora passalidarum NRRL Y-27907]|uniref:Uncharacterized protein n=1 Tax=Spathaspora passalidarum (strain NRRL Y-27907 / 11-Y1) TaxID=619300 RepID=G3AFW8_SPAPN|nr:uncharacterized protein SPAPADRAFT_131868 [Spathaspora passalidarum NRRL Y-27907]EGW35107.1 hypothetical protein SPAPADRAFT_131868 [Spathaspora passalidarum NRRL Y-27907]
MSNERQLNRQAYIIRLLKQSPQPLYWIAFLSLNPIIKRLLLDNQDKISQCCKFDTATFERRTKKLANLISCCFLYSATVTNKFIPKDYGLIYFIINYYGELNTPSNTKIQISPNYSKYFKLETYRNHPTLVKLYENKEFFIFPAIFAQLLSNYLTPTRYKLNQRYLSSSIKSRIFAPIWKNFSLGVNHARLNWISLLRNYLIQNYVIIGFLGLLTIKTRLLDRLYEVKYKKRNETELSVVLNYWTYNFHRANSIVNFIYAPNMIAILLITLTSPMFRLLKPKGDIPKNTLQKLYKRNYKLFFKSYTKTIGFVAAFLTLYLNALNVVPALGYKDEEEDETENIRTISKSWLNDLDLYLFRLILLSKWRITKENHPSFKIMKLKNWIRLETLLMCFGVFKVMNLNDYIKKNKQQDPDNYQRLKDNTMIRMVDCIM